MSRGFEDNRPFGFSQYRSCDDIQETRTIFSVQSLTFSSSHAVSLMNRTKVQTSQASSHDLYYTGKKIGMRKGSVKFLIKHRQSMGKVELYFSVAGFPGEGYRGIVA